MTEILLNLGPDHHDHVDKHQEVDNHDDHHGDPDKPGAVAKIHPAVVVHVLEAEEGVGYDGQAREPPPQATQQPHAPVVIVKSVEENHLQVGALAHHPEVGGHREVHHHGIEQATPDRVLGPDVGVIEDGVTPEQPEDIAEDEAEEHVDVNSDPATQERLVTEEHHDGHNQEQQGQNVANVAENQHIRP